eukprot:Hpha_TRINITY_DN16146_c1_g2::TRINITY_DN16146_c1_g2_i1::g.3799::m.3799
MVGFMRPHAFVPERLAAINEYRSWRVPKGHRDMRHSQYPVIARGDLGALGWFSKMGLLLNPKGTCFAGIWYDVLLLTVWATAVYLAYRYDVWNSPVSDKAHTWTLSPLSFLVVFSCSHAYSRYWSGRSQMSNMTYFASNFMSTLVSIRGRGDDEQEKAIEDCITNCTSLLDALVIGIRHAVLDYWPRKRNELKGESQTTRDEDSTSDGTHRDNAEWTQELEAAARGCESCIKAREYVAEIVNIDHGGDPVLPPYFALHMELSKVRPKDAAEKKKYIPNPQLNALESDLDGLMASYFDMLRATSVPLAYPWLHLLKIIIWTWLLTAPFPLISKYTHEPYLVIPSIAVLSFIFLGLVRVFSMTEIPFGPEDYNFCSMTQYRDTMRNVFMVRAISDRWSEKRQEQLKFHDGDKVYCNLKKKEMGTGEKKEMGTGHIVGDLNTVDKTYHIRLERRGEEVMVEVPARAVQLLERSRDSAQS